MFSERMKCINRIPDLAFGRPDICAPYKFTFAEKVVLIKEKLNVKFDKHNISVIDHYNFLVIMKSELDNIFTL